ncbi:ABC transporter permease subunit [Acetobacter musti]|uniref:ABC transporter permease subunit n=1 Tax=Acetobacter musti TaxID=864732 RepID=A0ABX0JJ98_9PROT|nr:ABC transporter permease [Acetobacter musti]NHN83235.1 ABC transporter permease subunit [Acetobacter musti]
MNTVRRLLKIRTASAGLVLVALLALACVLVPPLLPRGPLQIDLHHRFLPPLSGIHPLGTDEIGRDILARLLAGARTSLLIGLSAMALSTVTGCITGGLTGFYGGWTRIILMRLVDAVLCFPTIFLLLTLASFGQPGAATIIGIVSLVAWMEVSRVVDGQIRALRDREFIVAVEAMGASATHMLLREFLPNIAGAIVVVSTLNVARAILMEAYVSYLGNGIQPPQPSLGNMLNDAQEYLRPDPWLAILPGIVIAIAVIGLNFIGDGLRTALDPRQSNASGSRR